MSSSCGKRRRATGPRKAEGQIQTEGNRVPEGGGQRSREKGPETQRVVGRGSEGVRDRDPGQKPKWPSGKTHRTRDWGG